MSARFYHITCAILLAAAAPAALQTTAAQNTTLPDQVILPQADPEVGRSFIANFSPTDYDAHSQNWAVVEDDRGVTYVGNNAGLLEYDGVEWRLMQMPNRSTVRSLDKDSEGRIWVGGDGDLGYLEPDSLGRTTFVSLLDEVPEAYRSFSDTWTTHATDDGIYFNIDIAILRWDGSAMQAWEPDSSRFHVAAVVDGTYYVREWDHGLLRMERTPAGDSLRLIPGGERFANKRVYVMLPFGDGRVLIGTREDELSLWNPSADSEEDSFESFETEADEIIASGGIYLPGAVLPGGNFAIGTLTEGMVVIDHEGRLIRQINRTNGLPDNTIYLPYVDTSGSLWLGMGNGLSRVEMAAPLTHYDATTGIDGVPFSIVRHNGILYVGLNDGLSILDTNLQSFRRIENVVAQIFDLLPVDDHLLVAAGNDGVYRIEGERLVPVRLSVSRDYGAAALHRWSRHPGIVVVGLYEGLGVLSRRGNEWTDEGLIPGFGSESWGVVEDADGTIWATGISHVARVRLPSPGPDGSIDLSQSEVTVFGTSDGLVEGYINANRIGDEVYFTGVNETVFRFDDKTGRFVSEHKFDAAGSGHPLGAYLIREDMDGRVWISSTYGAPVIGHPNEDGGYAFETLHQLRNNQILDSLPEDGGITWLVGLEGLVRYDTNQATTAQRTKPPIIRRVTVGDEERFGGTGDATALEVAHGTEAVHFAYAAPGAAAPPRYRTQLAGFDADWSAWTSETAREYTNLPPGDYEFVVEAEGRGESIFALTVLPPWYRTWWAYLGFALLFALATFGVDRVQRYRLGKKELERSILREAELRAEAENRRREDAERLSEIGQAITSTLSTREIIDTVYEHVNALMDAAVFGIGIYNSKDQRIDFPATKENGLTLPSYSNDLDDRSRPAVWCFTNREEFIVGDFAHEYQRYVPERQAPIEGEEVASIIYLPLVYHDKAVGVVTTQSFTKNAYSDYHVSVLRTLATYAAIAIDNAAAYRNLKATQQQLVQQEKLASLGQLTAGIAHEIKNPLNFINNFASLSGELADDLQKETDPEAIRAILADIKLTASKIEEHGQRADGIVRSMMQHAREGSSEKEKVDLNALVAEHISLAYHGKRAQSSNFSVEIEQELGEDVGQAVVVAQDLGRVLLNLIGNAFDAVLERAAKVNGQYDPKVKVTTRQMGDHAEISVMDNGPGIPADVEAKIFEPFFTTKPTGQGTGLGLSMSYEIITQGHDGSLTVESRLGQGTAFVIRIPTAAG